MSLKVKTLLFVAALVGVLLGSITLGVRTIVLANFAELERKATERTLRDTKSILETVVEEFNFRGLDWSDWDDLAVYIDDLNAEFKDGNLSNDALASVNWSHLVLVREGGEIIFGARYNEGGPESLPISNDLAAFIKNGDLTPSGRVVSGIVRLDDQLHFIASRPILKTDHSSGPRRGHMITTRVIDEAQVARLRKFTFLNVSLEPLWIEAKTPESVSERRRLDAGEASVLVDREKEIVAFTRMKDIVGRDLFELKLVRPRQLIAPAEELLTALQKALFAASIALALVAVLGMSAGVLRPLAAVMGGVRRLERGERALVEIRSKDEIGVLGNSFNQMAKAIADREDALKLVLDSTGDGLVLMSPTGVLKGQASAPAVAWFGDPTGKNLADWLPLDERARTNLELGLEQLSEDFMPFEVTVAMLPGEFSKGERTYRVKYQEVRANGVLSDVLVVLSDATDQVAAERSEREGRELQAIGRQALRDRNAVASFLAEADAISESLVEPRPLAELKRAIHTLKGNAAIFGLESVSEACHDAENLILEDAENVGHALEIVRASWRSARSRIESVFGGGGTNTIELDEREYEQFLERLLAARADHQLVTQVRAWRNVPTKAVLERLAGQVGRVAERLEKEVEVVIVDDGQRLPSTELGGFIASLIHVVRNAVDHGIESPAERRTLGKSPVGSVELRAKQSSEGFVLEIVDDGRGLDWEGIAARARALGLAVESKVELEQALFAEGVTTASEVTDVSGRGVGMGAVERACVDAGGRLTVESTRGIGTTFRFVFPIKSTRAAA